MQEARLSQNIAHCLGIPKAALEEWMSENASGCLGEELRIVQDRTNTMPGGHISPLSIAQIDHLIDELAAHSSFSEDSIRNKYPTTTRRARRVIIGDLFRSLSPMDAGFLTQIILKDLRPILYPLRDTHYTAALLAHNTESVKMLSRDDAMMIWDPSKWMIYSYRVTSNITDVANRFELPPNERGSNVPKIGVPVTIPKSEKGRSPRHALEHFRQPQQVWAETKYDGERAQIHVEILPSGAKITIFSKSKRDSTWDRAAIHGPIRRALGLSEHGTCRSKVRKNVILDAEMVVFNGERIDEFWRIRGFIKTTAKGPRGRRKASAGFQEGEEEYSQSSMVTDLSDNRQLGVVFFDVLSLDFKSLLMRPYSHRRKILEDLVEVIPGVSILAQRVPVNYGEQRLIALEKIFSAAIADCEEGLVLKGDDSKYHDFSTPWVKLKKDYIPKYGDTVDMAVLGVAWERERGRSLRVPPSTTTTFFIGGLENAPQRRRQRRSSLAEYTFSLLPGLQHPQFMLKTPLLAELFGAGFTKSPHSRNYELRFPRLSKLHRPSERGWQEGVNLQDLHKIACEVIGRDNSEKEARDATARMWGKPVSPGARSRLKRKATGDLWEERFASMDGRAWTRTPIGSQESSPIRVTRARASSDYLPGASPSMKRKATENLSENTLISTVGKSRTKARVHRSPPSSPGWPSYAATRSHTPVAKIPLNGNPVVLLEEELATTSSRIPLGSTGSTSQRTPRALAPKTNTLPGPPAATTFDAGQDRDRLEVPHPVPTPPASPKTMEPEATSAIPSLVCDLFVPPTPAVSPPPLKRKANGRSFLENALVWLAKPRGKSSPGSKWTLQRSIPREQQLHSIESLLTGCGWCVGTHGTIWAKKGVIFIDENDVTSKILARDALEMINERARTLPAEQPRKTIWIFDRGDWTLEAEDVEHLARHRLD
ncbi:hypothetical protein DXG03_003829 [Asterophora parasitica]|uniref:ATP-dependent DNA ligase family profile domain-containing protein n=1 Tax=Asterophora parasitica TaxID=117018 RepID=A0A9P7G2X6_9AGAR|nr:hypothetical protein DXG03_003829 [Asterophora parasitica]